METRKRGETKGTRIKIDFNKVEKVDIGEYEPEIFEEGIEFNKKDYSTLIRIEKLRWDNINKQDFINYLKEKHFPLLLDEKFDIKIFINGFKLKCEEPKDAEKYIFDSFEKFFINEKYVPARPDLSCGQIQGTFYLNEETWGEESSIDIYVKNQRIDGYSGDKVDWLRIKDLSSPEGFRRRIKGVIKVKAVEEKKISRTSPIRGLVLKSDRTAFFENKAYGQLCAYLNGTIKNQFVKLPFGGILRIINDN